MSTERRRSSGGRRRASGSGGAERESARTQTPGPAADDGGFWEDERPSRRSEDARSETGRRASAEEGGRRSAAHDSRSGGRRAAGGSGGGGRRPPQRGRSGGDDGRGPVRRFFSRAWKPALIVCGVGFVLSVAGFGVAYAMLPGANEMGAKEGADDFATTVSFENGDEAVTLGATNRTEVDSEQIPPEVISGVLGSEQRKFYEEAGVSVTGTMRALLSGGEKGGGSTITQQMARNYYSGLSKDRTVVRKAKEIVIALKLGNQLSKEQILEQYLNTIYFGRGAYGIQAASQAYFEKDVEDISAAEGAFLGAIIQQPGNFQNVQEGSEMEEILRDRWEYAVEGISVLHDESPKHGMPKEETKKLEFPETVDYNPDERFEKEYTGFIKKAVTQELKDRYDLTAQDIATGGYTVQTSLDEDLMQAAGKAFDKGLPEGMPEETKEGLASVDPATGEIRAFHGGGDWTADNNDSLTHRAQAGSAFKPYVLATGLKQGIGLRSKFDGDSPQDFPGIGEPIQNNNDNSYGPVSLVESTAKSINTSFVQLAIETGPEKVNQSASDAGIPEEQFETAQLGPNIALGTYQVTALDQASGFSTFANKGVHMPRHMVTSLKTADGGEEPPNDADQLEVGKRAFSADVAADATHAMTKVAEDSEAALPDGRAVAGKTGTSNSAKSAWFVGYTPQLSTAVGLSRGDGKKLDIPGVRNIYGGTTSAKVWREFMITAMEGEPQKKFPDPAWVGEEKNFGPTPEPSGQSPTDEPEETEEPEETSDPTQTPDPTQTTPPESSDPTTSPDDECTPSIWNDCPGNGGDDGSGDGPGDGGGDVSPSDGPQAREENNAFFQ